MEQTLSAWLIPVITLVVGVAIGYFIARVAPGTSPAQTQRKLDDIQDRFDAYQSDVINHFNTTAHLVNKLAQSHQEVQAHLSASADRLALDEQTRQRLLIALNEAPKSREKISSTSHSEPPKDYAPKDANTLGTLDASFGLKK